MAFYYIAAGIICFAAIFHSILGEKHLIVPTLAADDPFIQQPITQAITRFGWHAATGFMLLTALIIILPDTPLILKFMTGILWLVLGISNLIMTRAKHPGGPLLSTIGILILLGYFL